MPATIPIDDPPFGWREVRLFISSTFRDFHAERDYLIKWVFPGLRQWCRQWRLHFVDIDLRWGITEEQAHSGKVIDLCLEQVDGSRPFFLCMLGERYGCIPEREEIERKNPDSSTALASGSDSAKSITHLEIRHAVFEGLATGSVPETIPQAFFYFRSSKALPCPDGIPFFTDKERLAYVSTFFEGDAAGREHIRRLKTEIIDYFKNLGTLHNLPNLLADRVFEYMPAFEPGCNNPEDDALRGRFKPESLAVFGERVLNDLRKAIEARFANRIAALQDCANRDSIAHERTYHEYFIENRTLLFVGRENFLAQLKDFIDGPAASPLLLVGSPGVGKSSLLARLCREILNGQGTTKRDTVAHFIGASPESVSTIGMLRRLCNELNEGELCEQHAARRAEIDKAIKALEDPHDTVNAEKRETELKNLRERRFALDEEYAIPVDLDELNATFKRFLRMLVRPWLLVIDGVNQLEEAGTSRRLGWLPVTMPPHVKLIISCIEGDVAQMIAAVCPQSIRLSGLTETEREQALRRIPTFFAKTLDDRHLALLVGKESSGNPLFLRVALEELRISGSYEKLSQEIKNLPGSLDELFMAVLARLERDFGSDIIEPYFCLLECSRHGLTESELGSLVAQGENDRRHLVLLRQVRDYMHMNGELVDFFHRSFSKAVRTRYLTGLERKQYWHRRLAGFYAKQPLLTENGPNRRRLFEEVYQLQQEGRWGVVCERLSEIPYLYHLLKVLGINEALNRFDAAREQTPLVMRLHQVLQMSARVLSFAPDELASQLFGRLADHQGNDVAAYVRRLAVDYPRPWLMPQGPGLYRLGQTRGNLRREHSGSILGISILSKLDYIVTVGRDGRVIFWDSQRRSIRATAEEHRGHAVLGVASTTDESMVATFDDDGVLVLWKMADVPIATWMTRSIPAKESNRDAIHSCSIASDKSKILYCTYFGKRLVLYHFITGQTHIFVAIENRLVPEEECDEELLKRIMPITGVYDFGDTGTFAVAMESCFIVVPHGDLERQWVTLSLGAWRVTSVNRSGVAVVGTAQGFVICLDLQLNRVLFRTKQHDSAIAAIDIAEDGHTIVSVDTTGRVKVWHAKNTIPFYEHTLRQPISCSRLDSSTGVVLIGTLDGDFLLLAPGEQETVISSAHDGQFVEAAAISPDGASAVTVDRSSKVLLWQTSDFPRVVNNLHGDVRIRACTIQDSLVALGTDNGSVAIWNTSTENVDEHAFLGAPITTCSFCNSGEEILAGDLYGNVGGLTVNEGTSWQSRQHKSAVVFAASTREGIFPRLVSIGWDGVSLAVLMPKPLTYWTVPLIAKGCDTRGQLWVQFVPGHIQLRDVIANHLCCSLPCRIRSVLGCLLLDDILWAWSQDGVELWDIIRQESLASFTADRRISTAAFTHRQAVLGHEDGHVTFCRLCNPSSVRNCDHRIHALRDLLKQNQEGLKQFSKHHRNPIQLYSENESSKEPDIVFQKMVDTWEKAMNEVFDSSLNVIELWQKLSPRERFLAALPTPYALSNLFLLR